jgi:DNA polymerase-3 subunit delta
MPKKAAEIISRCPLSAAVTANAKSGPELERYIEHIARRECRGIEPQAVRALAALCGDNLMLICSEIKKMAALAEYAAITAEHVEALGIRTAEAGVYRMIGAIERGRLAEAVDTLCDMMDDLGEPLAVTAALNAAFINLYRARIARETGRPMGYLCDAFGYKKGDRRMAIAYERSAGYSVGQLERIIGILYGLDVKLKSSSVAARYLIEQKVVELSLATQ